MKKNIIWISMLSLLSIAGYSFVTPQEQNNLTASEKAAGWRLLFNGTTFEGWHGYRKTEVPASWKIEDGVLKTLPKTRGGDLITTQKFTDFELSWEWNLAKGANNGIKYFVTEERPTAPGHEYQMIDATNYPGKLHPNQATASFYDVLPPEDNASINPYGQWNVSRVLVLGNHVEHWLNGKKVLVYELGSERVKAGLAESKFRQYPDFGTKIQGHIMLTYHNDECWFRNIKIRDLPSK